MNQWFLKTNSDPICEILPISGHCPLLISYLKFYFKPHQTLSSSLQYETAEFSLLHLSSFYLTGDFQHLRKSRHLYLKTLLKEIIKEWKWVGGERKRIPILLMLLSFKLITLKHFDNHVWVVLFFCRANFIKILNFSFVHTIPNLLAMYSKL